MDKRSVLGSVALLLAVFTAARAEAASESQVSLAEFQANGIMARGETGDTMSGQVSWNPMFPMGSFFVRGDVGASMYKGTVANFMVFEAGARGGLDLGSFDVEVGPMAQMWLDRGTHFGGLAQFSYGFGEKLLGMADHVFLSGGALFPSGSTVIVGKLGVGFSF